jgi:imidazole glycerol-phosphate synthase subunit HisH
MKIAIIKYGMGNIASVEKSIKKLGFESIITDNHSEIQHSDFIILPGVGSFQKGMENLNKSGLVDLLTDEVVFKKKPFLGICLGMQLLSTYGTEPSKVAGLGWINGEVVKIETRGKLRIPHLGWNNVFTDEKATFYQEFDGLDYYFIHSYHFKVKNQAEVVLRVMYDEPLVAALQKENIYAVQFHPEKSQDAGMRLLKKIIDYYAKV